MAANADSVVVDLVANVEGFNKNVTDASKNFDQSMNAIEQSAGKAEKAHSRLTLAANNNRVSMLELQHVIRGSTDQFAAGAPLTQIFAQHIASVGEAAALSGSSLGAIGKFLAGPWGLALTAAVGIAATLIGKHKEEGETVEGLVAKLKEHAEKTHLSEEADRIWTATIDGLIEKQKELNKTLGERLQVQSVVDENQLAQERSKLADTQRQLTQEQTHLADLKKQLAATPSGPTSGGVGIGQGASVGSDAGAGLINQIATSEASIAKLKTAIQALQTGVTQSSIVVAQTEGKAIADLTTHAQLFGEKFEAVMTQIVKDNPKLAASATQIEAAGAALISAANDAASAGVDFVGVTNKVEAIDRGLDTGKISVRTYATEIAKLTKTLNDMTEAAKEAAKHKIDPVTQFKQAVIGAEGTGANKAGSPAAGFGQFMPDTWLSYFNKLFPDKADLDSSAKLAYRNVRAVAEAVIDKATDDYKAVLTKAGQTITAAGLYTVHVLGAPDAAKLFAAPPGESARAALGGNAHADRIVAQNGSLFTGTVAQAQAALAKRIGDSSAAVSAGAVAIAQAAEQEKQREAAYGQKVDEVEGQILAARKELGLTAEETAQIENLAADAAAKKYQDDVRANIIDAQGRGKYTKEEADNLIRLSRSRTDLIKEIIARRLQEAQFRQQEAAEQNIITAETGQLEAHQELLRSYEQLAKTAKERKAIEDRLIDLQYDEERIQLQAQIAAADRLKALAETTKNEQDIAAASKAEADAARARAKLNALPQEQANAHQANAQQNASPLQSYFNSIPKTADEINSALENIAVNGLQNFNDKLTDAIVNFHSLGDVGRAVLQGIEGDLIQLALKLIEQHTIGTLLASTSSASSAALAAPVAAAWAGPAAMVSLATFGANAIPAEAALATTTALAFAFGAPKAGGGRIFGPGGDTSDGILTPTSRDEFVIRASAARALGFDVLDYINSTGELPRGFANGGAIRPMNLQASGTGSRGGFSPSDIMQLRGMFETAIRAMPDIKLYPTIDSGEMLKRGIETTQGSRAVIAHVSDNSTRFKTAINRP